MLRVLDMVRVILGMFVFEPVGGPNLLEVSATEEPPSFILVLVPDEGPSLFFTADVPIGVTALFVAFVDGPIICS
jgi:hypothetical protein